MNDSSEHRDQQALRGDDRTDEQRAGELSKSASPETGEPTPPAANQQKDEPVDAPAAADDASQVSPGGTPPATAGGVPAPGDSRGVSVPAVQATAGTSEGSERVEGVRIVANAPPGKPDGEVDTRR